ncbi:hypothetical protein MRB53_041427 [Persea americana]|nr:hypothetical protein MRB53_041427 [Persea americana]
MSAYARADVVAFTVWTFRSQPSLAVEITVVEPLHRMRTDSTVNQADDNSGLAGEEDKLSGSSCLNRCRQWCVTSRSRAADVVVKSYQTHMEALRGRSDMLISHTGGLAQFIFPFLLWRSGSLEAEMVLMQKLNGDAGSHAIESSNDDVCMQCCKVHISSDLIEASCCAW